MVILPFFSKMRPSMERLLPNLIWVFFRAMAHTRDVNETLRSETKTRPRLFILSLRRYRD